MQHGEDLASSKRSGAPYLSEVLNGDACLAPAASHLNAPQRLLGGHVQVNDDVWLLHEVGHVVEQRDVRVVVSLVHQPCVLQHLREHSVCTIATQSRHG